MTSLLTSFFSSANTALHSRVEALRVAEASLATHAAKFGPAEGHHHQDDHVIETFDTRIPRSSVPLTKANAKCQIETVKKDDDFFVVHGVKVSRASAGAVSGSTGEEAQGTSSSSSSSSSPGPLVILHGYMNGSLYFYRNLLGLSNHFNTVYSLDQLGWGLSSRPSFDHVCDKDDKGDEDCAGKGGDCKIGSFCSDSNSNSSDIDSGDNNDDTKKAQRACSVTSSESFFVESLEAWRAANSIPKMNLCGHSMGGYLSVAYAERYPHRVDNLILLSPVGVPESPEDKGEDDPMKSVPFRYKVLFGTFRFFWSRGTTPGSFARSFLSESRARSWVDRYVEGRLPSVQNPDERQALSDYLFHSAMLPGSGEYCLNRLLKPGAYARKPLVKRIPSITGIEGKITFVYGQNDWMDPQGGLDVQRRCDALRASGERNVPEVDVCGVRNAGHMLQIENYAETNSAVIQAAGGTAPWNAPVPVRFRNEDTGGFFRGSRFNRRNKEEEEGEVMKEEEEKKQDAGDVENEARPVADPVGA